MELLTIAIPIYNETKPVINLIRKVALLKQPKEVIIIDDGSTLAATKKIFDQLKKLYPQFIFLRNEINSGKAFSIRRALSIAKGKYFVVLDGDGELDPQEISHLYGAIITNKADMISGVRVVSRRALVHENINLISKIAKRLTTWAIRLFYGREIKDVLSGYKMFRTGIFKKLDIKSHRFGLEVELLTLAIINNLKIGEIDVNYNPRSYKEGKKINIFDSFEMLRMLISRSNRLAIAKRVLIPIIIFMVSFMSFTHSLNYFHTTDSIPVNLTAVNILYNHRLDLTNFKSALIDRDLIGITIESSNGYIYSKAPVILSYFSIPAFFIANRYFGIKDFNLSWVFDNNYLQYLGKINAVFYVSLSGAFLYLVLYQISRKSKISILATLVYLYATNVANTAAQANWQHAVSLCLITLFMLILLKAKYLWHFLVLGIIMSLLVSIRISNIFYILTIPIYFLLDRKSWREYIGFNSAYLASFLACFGLINYYLRKQGVPYGYSNEIAFSLSEISIPLFFQNLSSLLFSYNYGLFYFSPVLLLIFFSPFHKNKLALALLPTVILFLFFASIWWMWTGGMSLNARLLSEIMPVLTIFLLLSIIRFSHLLTYRFLLFIMLVISLYNNFLTTYMMDYNWHDLYLEHGGHHSQVHNAWVNNPTLLKYLSNRRYITTSQLQSRDGILTERVRVYRPSLKYFGLAKLFDSVRAIYPL